MDTKVLAYRKVWSWLDHVALDVNADRAKSNEHLQPGTPEPKPYHQTAFESSEDATGIQVVISPPSEAAKDQNAKADCKKRGDGFEGSKASMSATLCAAAKIQVGEADRDGAANHQSCCECSGSDCRC